MVEINKIVQYVKEENHTVKPAFDRLMIICMKNSKSTTEEITDHV